MSLRPDGRAAHELRRIEIRTNFTKWAEGSVLCCFGDTQVLCNATVEERLPGWLKDQGRGWVTAEYSMLPRATDKRSQREAVQGKQGGRTHEISRLIGRSLRAAINLQQLGERSVTIDCDVIQADGGTRTAAITGGWVALSLAVQHLIRRNILVKNPVQKQVAAVSLGVWRKEVVLDLDFKEDQDVDTDLNLVMTGDGGIIEVQGTAEKAPLGRDELNQMVELGWSGIQQLMAAQRAALEPK